MNKAYLKWRKEREKQEVENIKIRSFQNRYNQLVNEFDNNSEKLKSYATNWADTKSSDEQKIYYLDLRKKQKTLLKDLDSYKDAYVSRFGEDSFNRLSKGINSLGKSIKKNQKAITDISKSYSLYKTADEYNAAVKNFNAQKQYGKNLTFDTWKQAKDSGDDSEYINNYAINQGYKDEDFYNSYIKYLDEKVEELKTYGTTNSNQGYYNPATETFTYYSEYIKQSEIDSLTSEKEALKKAKADLHDVKQVQIKEDRFKNSEDFDELTKGIDKSFDFDAYFRGMDAHGVDKIMFGGRSGDGSPWMDEMPQYAIDILGNLEPYNFDAFTFKQKKYIYYLVKKIGKTKREFDERYKNGKIATSVYLDETNEIDVEEFSDVENSEVSKTKADYITAERAYVEPAVNELINYIAALGEVDPILELIDEKNYEALKNGSDLNKAFTGLKTVVSKPTADFLSAVGTVVEISTEGEINPDSGWHALSNSIETQRNAITESAYEKYGTIGSLATGGALSLADMLWASVISGGFGANAPSIVMSTGAFSNTVLDAKKRGLSDGQSILLGGIAAIAEFFTEKMSFGRFFDALEGAGTKSLKSTLVNILKSGLKSAPKEFLEEGLTSYINNIADTFIAGDKSNLVSSIENYKKDDLSDEEAMKQALFDNFLNQPLEEATVGAVIGFLMGSGGSVANYTAVSRYINSDSAQQYAKGRLLKGDYGAIVEKAKQFGASTKAFENAMAEVERIANSDYVSENTREIRYVSAMKKAQTEFLRLEYCADSMEAYVKENKKTSKENQTGTDSIVSENDRSKISADKLFKKAIGGNNSSATPSAVDTNASLDTGAGFVEQNNMPVSENVSPDTVSSREINDGEFLINKFKNDNKLARIRESAKTETAANDLSQHYDDVSYTNVYNELLNTNEVASAGPMEAVRKSKEFNRIYEMGIEEEILPHNIKSDIFTPEQVRRIYTAGVVDDNANNYNKQLDFNEVLNEYEQQAESSKKDSNKSKNTTAKVDKGKNNHYNKTKGGVNDEESADSELLEGNRRTSTIGRNRDGLWKQSSNSKKISKLLGLSAKNIKAGESTGSGVFDSNVERFYSIEGRVRSGPWESAVRDLSGIDLQPVDTIGRYVPKIVLEEFNDTVFKTSDGKILSLYHWTNAKFNIFAKGDIGYHFGVLEASDIRRGDKQKKEPNNKISIYKEVYLNIKNPILIPFDVGIWTPFSTAHKLLYENVISETEFETISKLDGFNEKNVSSDANLKMIEILKQKGIDGIVYTNDCEGGYSVIAFHPEQIYTVAENGIDIETKAEPKDSAFSNATQNKNTDQKGGAQMKDIDSDKNYFVENKRLSEDDLQQYLSIGKKLKTRNRKRRLLESGKKPILTNDDEIREFINSAISGQAKGEVRAYAIAGEKLANAIKIKYKNIDISGKYIELVADDLRESFKRHSKAKQEGDVDLSINDFINIPKYIDNFDGVISVNSYNNKTEIHLYKKVNSNYIQIITVTSNERNSLNVSKIIGVSNEKFVKKYSKKIERDTGSPRSQTEDSTPSTKARHTAGALSTNIITNSSENVKKSENDSENIKKAIKHKSPKDEWTAENKNADSDIEIPPAISEIIKTIKEEFNIPISKGKFKDRALGIYKTKEQTARVRVSNALPTVLHEALGHHLDMKYNFNKLSSIDEAIKVVDNLMPGFLNQYSKSEQPFEAVAEFMREYLTDKKRAKLIFPKFYVEFEKTLKEANNKDFEKLQKIADMTNAYMISDIKERTKSAVISRAEAKRRQIKAENLHSVWNKARARFQDEAIALKDIGGAYEQYYSAKEADMRVYSTITGEYMTAMDGNYAYKTDDDGKFLLDKDGNKILQKSLANILSQLPGEKVDSDFTDYLVCKHAIEWVNEDKRVFADDTLNDVEMLTNKVRDYEKKFPTFKQVSEEVYEYQNELLKQWLVVSGLSTFEDIKELKQAYPCYIPFQRDVGDAKNIGTKAKGSLANQQSGIKHAKGSGLDILNPIESIILNTEKFIKSAERNMVMREISKFTDKNDGFGELLEEIEPESSPNSISAFPVKAKIMDVLEKHNIDSDLFFSIDEAINQTLGANLTEWIIKDNQGRDVVYVSENGEKRFFQVHNKELLIALNGLNKPQINGFIKFMGGASRIMKATTTGLNVFWSLRSNIFRDFDSAYKYSKEKNFAVFAKDYVVSMWDAIKKSDDYKQYLAAGGGYSSIISNPKALTSVINKMCEIDEGKVKNFLNNAMKVIEAIEGVSDVIEAGPRVAEYKRVLKETGNKRKAVLAADEITVNFKRKGSYANTIEALFPYYNASVQGVSKIATTLANEETRTSFVVKSTVSAVLTCLMIFGWNGLFDDEDEYEKLSAYKRNNFYNFYVGKGKFISIPKSKDTAFLNSLFENIIFEITRDNHDFKENVKNFSSYVFDTFLPSGVPNFAEIESIFSIPEQMLSDMTLIGSVAEAMSNQNYMGSPIVPSQYENLEPWAQYDENTTAIAKWLGKLFNFSPMKIDHIITSNLGMVGDLLKDLTAEKKSLALGFDTLVSDSAYSNDIVNKFYDDFDSAEKAKNTSLKHRPKTAGKDYAVYSQYSMYKSVAGIFNSYADSDSENARDYKALRRDLLNDFNHNIAGNVDDRLAEIYNNTGDSEVFASKNFSDEVSIDGKKYKMSLDNFIKFFDDYNKQIDLLYEPILNNDDLTDEQKAKQLKSVKSVVYDNLSEYYVAQTNVFESEIAEHKDSKLMTSTDFLRALSMLKPAFADTDGSGYVSNSEKAAAINKSNVSNDIKSLLRQLDII